MIEIDNDELVINDNLTIRAKKDWQRAVRDYESWPYFLIGFNDLLTQRIILTQGIESFKIMKEVIQFSAFRYDVNRDIVTTHGYLMTKKYQTVARMTFEKPIYLRIGDSIIIHYNVPK